MKHWIIGFSPETYEIVKSKKIIGVRSNVWKSFSENMEVGDKFIGYVSRSIIFDSIGTIASKATFVDSNDMLFHEAKDYPGRRKVEFEKVGLGIPAKELFNGILPFNDKNTGAGNYIMLKGGFVDISKTDYEWLLKEFKK